MQDCKSTLETRGDEAHLPATPGAPPGFSKMMNVRMLEDPEKGFLHKDCIIIEAHVSVQKPKAKLVADYI